MAGTSETAARPGSRTAVENGCRCAVVDNNHGMFAPFPPDGWWITEGCPLHWDAALVEAPRARAGDRTSG